MRHFFSLSQGNKFLNTILVQSIFTKDLCYGSHEILENIGGYIVFRKNGICAIFYTYFSLVFFTLGIEYQFVYF